MPVRYIAAVADNTEKSNMVHVLGPKNGGLVYQRDNNTLYILDPDGAGFVAIGTGGNVASLILAQNKVIIGDAGGLGSAVDAGTAAANAVTAAGTVEASKVLVVDAQKALDTLRATGTLNLGGTGVPGAASVQTELTKAVTAFADTVAKAVFTVTVPNAAHAAFIEVDCLGVLGAGGAIGAGEATFASKYRVGLARTAGVNVVAAVSSVIGGVAATVAGGDAITSVVVTVSAITGAVGATNTFTINVAITRSGAGATNHTGLFVARLANQNITGVTIA